MITEELILPQMQIIALFCALARKCGAGWEESASRSLAAKEYMLQVTRSAHETSGSHHRSRGPLEYWDSDALHRDCELRPPSTQSMTRISAQKSPVTVFPSSFCVNLGSTQRPSAVSTSRKTTVYKRQRPADGIIHAGKLDMSTSTRAWLRFMRNLSFTAPETDHNRSHNINTNFMTYMVPKYLQTCVRVRTKCTICV